MPKFRRSRALTVGFALVLVVAMFSVDYTVKPGDTLGKIAAAHDLSLSDLLAANDISNPNLIYPGQKLTIPGTDKVHVVSFGETLGRIAIQYGSSVSSIAAANKLPNPNLIRVGQHLIVPSGGSGGGAKPVEDKISDRTGQRHIVKKGETVAQVAAQYKGVSVKDIVRANGIVGNVIYAGQALYLSGPGHIASGSSSETSYKVRRGDSLSRIAHAHGVSIVSLISANNIGNANLIRIGQVLKIPTGSNWVCPVAGASYRNSWGFPRGGGTRYHEGTDLFAKRGTPVRAPVSGTVRHVGSAIGGKQFSLEGSDNVRYIGTHMDSYGKDGRVSAGDIIGYVGNSGNAAGTSTHLHLGMYWKGTPVNPYPTLLAHGCQ